MAPAGRLPSCQFAGRLNMVAGTVISSRMSEKAAGGQDRLRRYDVMPGRQVRWNVDRGGCIDNGKGTENYGGGRSEEKLADDRIVASEARFAS